MNDLMHIDIEMRNGVAMVSTLTIAMKFNKRHDNILREVGKTKQRIEKCALPNELVGDLLLEETSSTDEQHRTYRMYWLNKDAFSLIVMGFNITNPEVMAWKVKFIAAFNRMEAALRQKALPPADEPQLPAHDSVDDLMEEMGRSL